MPKRDLHRPALLGAALAAALGFVGGVDAQPADDAAVTVLLAKPLADIEGKEGTMVTVDYPPGSESLPHRHYADVFVYVLEGTVVMQVEGSEAVTLTAGQTFHETPEDIHTVSRNASETEPAKLLVFMVKEEDAPATVPVE